MTPPAATIRTFHLDFDAFYASVEQRDNPKLRGRPVVVGAAPGGRGVVSACSYEARAFGVHSAMPVSEAARRCPNAVFLPVRMAHYAAVSRQVMRLLASFSPVVSPISIDEAFMEVAGLERLWGPPRELAERIRREVRERWQLTISIGGAATRYFAKLASARSKPDGVLLVPAGSERSFLARLEVRELWGIGATSERRLARHGLTRVEQLLRLDRATATALVGESLSRYLLTICAGDDPGAFASQRRSHSLSSETTFAADTADRTVLERTLLRLAHRLMERTFAGAWEADTVVLKVRDSRFRTSTVRRSLNRPVASAQETFEVARELLHRRWDGRQPLRLLGIGFAHAARHQYTQGELFDSKAQRVRQVEQTVARLRKDSRGPAITKASLLGATSRRRGPGAGMPPGAVPG